MIYYKNIIKVKRNNIYDVSNIMLNHVRLNKEYLILDDIILVILDFMPRLGRH